MQQLLDRFDPAVLPTGPWLIWTERVRGRGAARRRYRRDVGIVDEDIVAVRAASDIVAIITKYTQLRRSGSRWVGLCPFHAEKTPSFSVNQELGVYRCWGCQVSGDAITFIREKEQLDFVAAVELLAGWAGITLRYDDKDQGAGRMRRAKLVDAVASAVAWYHERLLSAPDAAVPRRYLRERGRTGDGGRAGFGAGGELLAGWAGITRRYDDKDQGAGRMRRAKLVDAVASAVAWYHERLLSAPDAAVARRYLRERGLTGDEVRAFQIGWAPEGWDTLVKALRLPDDIVEESGIGFVHRPRRQPDRFRGRTLFPNLDATRDAVVFGARVMPPSHPPPP